MMREFDDSTPVDAVPGGLPRGERLIWQGAPSFQGFAFRVLHIRAVAVYFAILMAWRFVADLHDGLTVGDGLISAAWILPLAAVALGLIAAYAWAVERSTTYTVTSDRLIVRHGLALPVTVTVPLGLVESVDLKRHADGSGEIAIAVSPKARLAYVMIWPHARPWRFARPEVALRAIDDVDAVATKLAEALATNVAPKVIHTIRTDPAAVSVDGPIDGPIDGASDDRRHIASAAG